MSKFPLYPPIKAVSVKGRATVLVTWKDGIQHSIDLAPFMDDHPGLEPITGSARFSAVRVGEWGRTLDWGDDLEIPGDVLWTLALQQDADRFQDWRRARGLTQEQAASELGISTRMVTYYESGTHPIPKTVTLARIGLDALRQAAA